MTNKFYKVVASHISTMEVEILEESNKRDISEALEFIESHPHEDAVWTLIPMSFET